MSVACDVLANKLLQRTKAAARAARSPLAFAAERRYVDQTNRARNMSTLSLQVPLDSGANLAIEIAPGSALFILGANGTGKSSLVHRFYAANSGKARRIPS